MKSCNQSFNCAGQGQGTLPKATPTASQQPHARVSSAAKTVSAPPLEYRDVFVLSSKSHHEGGLTSWVECGLKNKGIPVRSCFDSYAEDTAVAKDDAVTVGHYLRVSGLERKVVVLLHYKSSGIHHSNQECDIYDRFHAMSRCTSQLVIVEKPHTYSVHHEMEPDLD